MPKYLGEYTIKEWSQLCKSAADCTGCVFRYLCTERSETPANWEVPTEVAWTAEERNRALTIMTKYPRAVRLVQTVHSDMIRVLDAEGRLLSVIEAEEYFPSFTKGLSVPIEVIMKGVCV